MGKTIVVTVGSTHFDALIKIIDSEEFINEAKKQGYDNIIAQIGAFEGEIKNLKNYQKYMKPNEMKESFAKADLVIGHAGAGTIMEVMALGKPLIVVVNDILMENHQTELASRLKEEGIITMSTTKQFMETFKQGNFDGHKLTMNAAPFVHKMDVYFQG
ncbi:Glycosyltransferase family 28 C-terminal domain containing protein [Trichomonas vaginalis G3]|uniref:UDP-N-acetylglucosamine transferase subunit ALG13 n=1 Tax=Trichomonas vaginalis (strain ATCC PRA-98 / G3) TaxID=412133 RepID=A2D962_TRIV3|nr:glycosyl transferase [Trichomonas vaginalis G3]EAY23088.1 Glycosyltransferase family 28 C-terminal domain containing protein [Trichomonas vaginalis G3]KAI5519056.1 N-acetylglucosaminyldiphosphodolichol N-acetylglucosaminyltransferase protein [Trichomonas vaginalis G3]|eukprot:XP_001584074.1 glycosyl transferase [Trichomonas vaginalis G3]